MISVCNRLSDVAYDGQKKEYKQEVRHHGISYAPELIGTIADSLVHLACKRTKIHSESDRIPNINERNACLLVIMNAKSGD